MHAYISLRNLKEINSSDKKVVRVRIAESILFPAGLLRSFIFVQSLYRDAVSLNLPLRQIWTL